MLDRLAEFRSLDVPDTGSKISANGAIPPYAVGSNLPIHAVIENIVKETPPKSYVGGGLRGG